MEEMEDLEVWTSEKLMACELWRIANVDGVVGMDSDSRTITVSDIKKEETLGAIGEVPNGWRIEVCKFSKPTVKDFLRHFACSIRWF